MAVNSAQVLAAPGPPTRGAAGAPDGFRGVAGPRGAARRGGERGGRD